MTGRDIRGMEYGVKKERVQRNDSLHSAGNLKKHLSINESKQLFHYHDSTIETNQIYTFNMRYMYALLSFV